MKFRISVQDGTGFKLISGTYAVDEDETSNSDLILVGVGRVTLLKDDSKPKTPVACAEITVDQANDPLKPGDDILICQNPG